MAPELPLELPALDNTMGAWLVGTFAGVLSVDRLYSDQS